MSLVPAGYTFEVYRPDPISSRLEPTYGKARANEWRPSLDYKHRLEDVKNQYTPAEYYRHRLKTSGAYIRMIQRLEMRWNRQLKKFTHAAVTVQRVYRGLIGRRYFAQIKDLYYDDMLRRRYTQPAMQAYQTGEYEAALKKIELIPNPIGSMLQTVKVKSLYRLQRYEECRYECHKLEEMDKTTSESYFFHALSLVQQNQIEAAFEITREGILRVTNCQDDIFRLSAGLAIQLQPPNFDSAIDAYVELLRRDPRDFDAMLARASCYSCMQEWSDALVDLQNILAFVPVHRQALLLRARIHACNRRWKEAEKDYKSILYFEPRCAEALTGMQEIQQFEPDKVLHIEH